MGLKIKTANGTNEVAIEMLPEDGNEIHWIETLCQNNKKKTETVECEIETIRIFYAPLQLIEDIEYLIFFNIHQNYLIQQQCYYTDAEWIQMQYVYYFSIDLKMFTPLIYFTCGF